MPVYTIACVVTPKSSSAAGVIADNAIAALIALVTPDEIRCADPLNDTELQWLGGTTMPNDNDVIGNADVKRIRKK